MTTASLGYGYYGGLLSIGSELEEEIRERYTEGECYLLALALHSLELGELIAVVDGRCRVCGQEYRQGGNDDE